MGQIFSPLTSSRFGFQYFADTDHFRQKDLADWLPVMQNNNTGWLFIQSPLTRAIPQSILEGLMNARIEPVIQLDPGLTAIPSPVDLQLLIEIYAKWGIRYVSLYQYPNQRDSWPATAWAQNDLVERFMERFIPLGSAVVKAGMAPVFPLLKAGGNYWDTAFLKSALEIIKRKAGPDFLDKLVLSAEVVFSDKGLDWGSGGPERWTGTRPYHTPPGEQDHLGLYIFDWYNAISREILQKALPLFLVHNGVNNPNDSHLEDYQAVFQLLNNETANLPGTLEKTLLEIPANVIAYVFNLVGETNTRNLPMYNPDRKPTELGSTIEDWIAARKSAGKSASEDTRNHPITHYLLLPSYDWGISEWYLDVTRPFIKKHQPTIGFSLSEARLAREVTVIGGEKSFPESDLQLLRDSGCLVTRITGDGTTIASQLAER